MSELAIADVARFVQPVLDSVERVMVGQRQTAEYLLVALLSSGHVLLEDVPGTGKTTLARACAASLDLQFARVQCTPDLLPSDITGVTVYDRATGKPEFRPGPVMANLLLADEVNRATPRAQSALLEAMQERQITVDGVTHRLPAPFIVLATQNPVELAGTFPLPEAQLDRFMVRLSLGYPSETDEELLLERMRAQDPLDDLEPVMSGAELLPMRGRIADVYVEATVRRYLLQIIRGTRVHADVAVGASPRASLALFRTSQALAAIRGRDFVTPDDAKEMAVIVLPHRLVLRSGSRLRGQDAVTLVEQVLRTIDPPVVPTR